MTLKLWWRGEYTNHPERFLFEIIEEMPIDTTSKELAVRERLIHEELGVLGEQYFNQSMANGKFVSAPKSQKTKELMALKTKLYWDSAEGFEKKKRLSENNRRTKSIEQKNVWNREGVREKWSKRNRGKPKPTGFGEKQSKILREPLEHDGVIYHGFDELFKHTGISRYIYRKLYPERKKRNNMSVKDVIIYNGITYKDFNSLIEATGISRHQYRLLYPVVKP